MEENKITETQTQQETTKEIEKDNVSMNPTETMLEEQGKVDIPKASKWRTQQNRESSQKFEYAEAHHMRKHSRNTKRRRIMNGMDIAIVAIVLVVALCMALQFNPVSWLFGRNNVVRTIEYTIVINNIDESFANSIKEGQQVYRLTNTGVCLGSVCEEVIEDEYTELTYYDGKIELVPYGNRINLTIVIRSDEANYSDGAGYSIGSCRIAVGTEIEFKFPGLSATGTVININRIA